MILRPASTERDRIAPIRSELLMTSLLKGRLETDSEFSFYLSLSVLACLRITKGVPYDPNWPFFILPRPGSRKDRLSLPRIPIPGWFSLAWLKTILVRRYLCRITFTWIMKGFSEKALTVGVKTYSQSTKSFLSSASQATAGKKGKPRRAGEVLR